LVPEEEWTRRGEEALAKEILDGPALEWAGIEWPDVIEDGRPFRPYYGLPREARPGAPDRPMLLETNHEGYFVPIPRPTDSARLDRRAELRWFRSAFAAELARAAELFGRPPRFRWGLVVEQHD
jgi:hypothetical protein